MIKTRKRRGNECGRRGTRIKGRGNFSRSNLTTSPPHHAPTLSIGHHLGSIHSVSAAALRGGTEAAQDLSTIHPSSLPALRHALSSHFFPRRSLPALPCRGTPPSPVPPGRPEEQPLVVPQEHDHKSAEAPPTSDATITWRFAHWPTRCVGGISPGGFCTSQPGRAGSTQDSHGRDTSGGDTVPPAEGAAQRLRLAVSSEHAEAGATRVLWG